MSDIFEEVEESVRKDKVAEWWSKWGILVWLLGFAIIAAVAYMEWNNTREAKATEARIIAFEDARAKLEAGEYAEAQAEFKAIVDADVDLSPLAAQFLAKAYYEGNGDAGLAAQTLESSSSVEGPVERLAHLKAAYLRSDEMSMGDLEAFLGDLPAEPTALGALALELIAAKALKENDIVRARKEFSYLRFAPNAPQGVVTRAEIALGVIPVPETDETVEAPIAPIETQTTPTTEEENGQ